MQTQKGRSWGGKHPDLTFLLPPRHHATGWTQLETRHHGLSVQNPRTQVRVERDQGDLGGEQGGGALKDMLSQSL